MIVVIFIFWVIAIHVRVDGCLTARVGSHPALRPIRTLAVAEHPHTYPCHMWILGLGSNTPILFQYNQNIVTSEIQILEDEFWLDNKRSVDSADVTTIWIVIKKTWTYLLRPELDPGLLFVHQIGFSSWQATATIVYQFTQSGSWSITSNEKMFWNSPNLFHVELLRVLTPWYARPFLLWFTQLSTYWKEGLIGFWS